MQGPRIFAGVGFCKGGGGGKYQESTNLPCAKNEGEKGRGNYALSDFFLLR